LTAANAINDKGQVVGLYYDGWAQYGFLFRDGASEKLHPPGATSSAATAINDKRQVVGWYTDGNWRQYGFLCSLGK